MVELDIFLENLSKSISLFKPEFTLVITFIVALLFDLIFKKSKNISGVIALIGFAVAGIFLLIQPGGATPMFENIIALDPFGKFFKFIILLSSFFIVIMAFFSDELYKAHERLGEFFTLIVGMAFGMFMLISANNLIMVYLALETMSISSYILAGYTKEIKRSSEASLKYVIYGAVSSGIMIYGISILYGLTGTLNLTELNQALVSADYNTIALAASGIMIIAGIGYKISAVPFHFWTPDVYEGAPITITAYLSVASKAAGFAVLIRFLKVGFTEGSALDTSGIWTMLGYVDWKLIIAILSVLTMSLGNLVAVWQNNLKRLLAYSSIAHAGYMLMGVVVMTDIGVQAVLVYFMMYMFMNLGIFYVVMLFANKIGSEEIDDFIGLGHRAPLLGAAMVIFLISLTGLPPTAGFIGKFAIFAAVLKADLIWLAVVGVLNSVVSLFYYVKIFKNMYLTKVDTDAEKLKFSYGSHIITILIIIPNLLFGVYFTPILEWAKNSVQIFLG